MNAAKRLIKKLPGVRRIVGERNRLREEVETLLGQQEFPPGHYYSSIPDPGEVKGISHRTGNRDVAAIPGIDLDWEGQESTLRELATYYNDLPFGETEADRGIHRYYFANGYYSYADGILFFTLLRHLQPKRLIEVGSGFSSCLTLDVNELFLDGSLQCTFIEPYPERLKQNLRPEDSKHVQIIEDKVQNIDPMIFGQLEKNDILFIDSSHVGKAGGDVNFLFFEILPKLKPGVWIHIHDVFYPFEYPETWILSGRSWNEAYMVRCLLMNSNAFQIRLWGDALAAQRTDLLASLMPRCMKNTGASLWIEKTDSCPDC